MTSQWPPPGLSQTRAEGRPIRAEPGRRPQPMSAPQPGDGEEGFVRPRRGGAQSPKSAAVAAPPPSGRCAAWSALRPPARLPPSPPARLASRASAAMAAAAAAEQEQQQFCLLLSNLLSPDNAVRKQAEVSRAVAPPATRTRTHAARRRPGPVSRGCAWIPGAGPRARGGVRRPAAVESRWRRGTRHPPPPPSPQAPIWRPSPAPPACSALTWPFPGREEAHVLPSFPPPSFPPPASPLPAHAVIALFQQRLIFRIF